MFPNLHGRIDVLREKIVSFDFKNLHLKYMFKSVTYPLEFHYFVIAELKIENCESIWRIRN